MCCLHYRASMRRKINTFQLPWRSLPLGVAWWQQLDPYPTCREAVAPQVRQSPEEGTEAVTERSFPICAAFLYCLEHLVPCCSPMMGTVWACPPTEMPGRKIPSFVRLLKKHQRTTEIPNIFSNKSAPLKPPGVSSSLELGYAQEWRCRWWDGKNSVGRPEPRGATLLEAAGTGTFLAPCSGSSWGQREVTCASCCPVWSTRDLRTRCKTQHRHPGVPGLCLWLPPGLSKGASLPELSSLGPAVPKHILCSPQSDCLGFKMDIIHLRNTGSTLGLLKGGWRSQSRSKASCLPAAAARQGG